MKENLLFVLIIIATIFIVCAGVLPIFSINNVLFALLYLVILWPWIMVVIYKIVIALDNKINKI